MKENPKENLSSPGWQKRVLKSRTVFSKFGAQQSNPVSKFYQLFLKLPLYFLYPKRTERKGWRGTEPKKALQFQRGLSYFFLKCQKSDEELLRIFHVPAPCLEVSTVTRILVRVAWEAKLEGRSVLLFGRQVSNDFHFWCSKQDWINWKTFFFFFSWQENYFVAGSSGKKKMREKAITKFLFCHIQSKDIFLSSEFS